MPRFNDKELVEEAKKWKYPKIHNDFKIFTETLCSPKNFIEFWSCFNLISVGMLECKTWKDKDIKWIAIEPNKSYREDAMEHPKLKTMWRKISTAYLKKLEDIIIENDIKLVLARRVFPEIEENENWFIREKLARSLYNSGIELIVIEWRKQVKNAKPRLSNIEKEAYQFIVYYEAIKRSWDIILLRRREYKD